MIRTIHELFEEQAERTPENAAVVCDGRTLTYRELNHRANQLAKTLKEKKVGRDTIVGIMAERTAETVISLLAVLKSGGCYLPIGMDWPSARIKYMLEEARVSVVIGQVSRPENIGFHGCFVDSLSKSIVGETVSNLPAINALEDLCYVIFTSGSTGKPKGAMVEHGNVVNLVNALSKEIYYRYSGTVHKVALVAPFTFDASIKQLFPCLLLGHTLYIVPENARLDAEELANFFRQHSIDITDGTPAHLKLLSCIPSDLYKDIKIKHFIIGGEALPIATAREFLKKFHSRPLMSNVYGPTECCDVTTSFTFNVSDLEQLEELPIGYPVENAQTYVLGEDMCQVSTAQAGELYIGGLGVGRGYLNSAQLTAQRFVENPFAQGHRLYKTGDLVRRQEDGLLYYIGRTDHQLKIRGFRIAPEEIEAELLNCGLVKAAAVKSVIGLKEEMCLCAFYVPAEDCSSEEIRAYLSEHLPYYMVPSYFVKMEALPLTRNGKTDREALPEPDIARAEESKNYVAPRDEAEIVLEKLWKQVLGGLRHIGVLEDFFVLGGHSLKANLLSVQIEKEFCVRLPVAAIFANPTIRSMAEAIKSTARSSRKGLPTAGDREYYPLSPSQRWIYMSHYMAGGDIAWNMPGVILIEGSLDRGRLEAAFESLTARHEILRTAFQLQDGNPVQRIQQQVQLSVQDIELAELEWMKEAEDVKAFENGLVPMLQKFVQPFDLACVPLMRLGLAVLSQERHVLFFDIHHIVFDGVSVEIFTRELLELYSGGQLPPLEIQYKDFSQWVNGEISSGSYKKHEDFWRNTLSGSLPLLDFPSDYYKTRVYDPRGDRVTAVLGPDLNRGVKSLALEKKATLFMVLLTAYNILLYKYTGQKEFAVGTFVAGRPLAGLDNTIGMFVNTVVLRNFPNGAATFADFLAEVRGNCLKAYEHQDYPFEEILARLRYKREPGRNPVFDTMLLLQNFTAPRLSAEGIALSRCDLNLELAPLDMILEAREEEEDLKLVFTYKTSLLKKETAVRIVDDYIKILRSAVTDTSLRTDDFQAGIRKERLEDVLSGELDFNF